ncbi:tumor necrosis factor receptor superfamily member 10B [Candoia aspera]|uniref:tumor necrosis factor receptor superfamily member 10B n=1 Tax=Candoia aspera TaxID=51853 RepID=UPI002FD8543C
MRAQRLLTLCLVACLLVSARLSPGAAAPAQMLLPSSAGAADLPTGDYSPTRERVRFRRLTPRVSLPPGAGGTSGKEVVVELIALRGRPSPRFACEQVRASALLYRGPARLLETRALTMLEVSNRREAIMARLPQMPDPEVTAPMVPDDETKEFYIPYGNNEKHKCKKCPAVTSYIFCFLPGSYVLEPCKVPRTEGICQPCENGTFANNLNSFDRCFFCQVCRTLDEVEIKKCTATTDTECACKNGTFCSPSEPCETCHRCMQSCHPGEKKVQDCTPTSDIQCLPAATPSPPTGRPISCGCERQYVFCYGAIPKMNFHTEQEGTVTTRCCDEGWDTCLQKSLEPQEIELPIYKDELLSYATLDSGKVLQSAPKLSHSNHHLEHLFCFLQDMRASTEDHHTLSSSSSSSSCRTFCIHLTHNVSSSFPALSRSFDIFIREVPLKEWKRFMRTLNLTVNEITSAEMSGRYVNEQCHEMLRTWLDKRGQAASVNVLLKELCGMDLRGIVEKVKSALIAEGLYVYEE